jgi:hypothetical protein
MLTKGLEDVIDVMMDKKFKYRHLGKDNITVIMQQYFKKSRAVIESGEPFSFPNRFGTMQLEFRKRKVNEEKPFGAFLIPDKIIVALGYWAYIDFRSSHITINLGYQYKACKKFIKWFNHKLFTTDYFYELKNKK